MTNTEFRSEIAKASLWVESWPEWKQNVLVNSSKPSLAVPSTPVNIRPEDDHVHLEGEDQILQTPSSSE